ncbi:hypothetical protein KAH37_10040 [bacterium]|nr:hypothetical protein [bacterium]
MRKILFLLVVFVMLFAGCRDTNDPASDDDVSDTANSVTDVDSGNTADSVSDDDVGDTGEEGVVTLLVILYDSEYDTRKTMTVEKQGDILIDVHFEDEPEGKQKFIVLASQDGFYTKMYPCDEGETITVSLDKVTTTLNTGVAFEFGDHDGFGYLDNHTLIFDPSLSCDTDENGRYIIQLNSTVDSVQAEPEGEYTYVNPGNESEMQAYEKEYSSVAVDATKKYQDFLIPAYMPVYKPNIYLYPKKTIDLDVILSFPLGGHVTVSSPKYGDGWHVTVEPDGTINNDYTFLFYESVVPDRFQRKRGWVVADSDLETFFSENLYKTGLRGQELQDFMDWWMPRWKGMSKYYAVYPQYNREIDPLIEITFSTPLDNFIRLFYIVDAIDDPEDVALETPEIPEFKREGFFGVEWGVIGGNMGIDPTVETKNALSPNKL